MSSYSEIILENVEHDFIKNNIPESKNNSEYK